MSEFIKCDGCGRMAKKEGDAAEDWSIIVIKTCHGNSLFGDDYKSYHACPECRKNLLEVLSLSEIESAGTRRL